MRLTLHNIMVLALASRLRNIAQSVSSLAQASPTIIPAASEEDNSFTSFALKACHNSQAAQGECMGWQALHEEGVPSYRKLPLVSFITHFGTYTLWTNKALLIDIGCPYG